MVPPVAGCLLATVTSWPCADQPALLTCVPTLQRKLTGIMNFTNPGAISHNEILEVRGQLRRR